MEHFTLLKTLTIALFLMVGMGNAWGQFEINAGSTDYTQDFNTLTNGTWTNNTTLTGWYSRTTATASINTYAANTGSTTTAGLYAFGVLGVNQLSDRALGYVASNTFTGTAGSGKGYLGWRLKNNTGNPITSITVTWTGEQWRKNDNANAQTLNLFYSTGTTVTDLISGTWTTVNSVFTSPITGTGTASLDGNASANRDVDITASINVNIPAGEEIMLRWEDLNDSGNDHFMAIDDVKVNATIESSSTPLITVSESSLIGFTYLIGSGPSVQQSFTVEGSNLIDDITIAPPANYEISQTSGSGFSGSNIILTQSGGTVSSTTIYVRLEAGLSVGTYNGQNITCSSTNADSKTVTCSGSVTRPENPTFTATANGTDQIDLEWLKNGNGNNVMIVFDQDGSFTDPVDGTPYSVSSSALGGTVIYNGSGTSFNHTGLSENTQYFYKAWSVDGSNNYSSGVTDNATTALGPITLFPYSEDFESGTFPPVGWSVFKAGDNNNAWIENNSIWNSSSHSAYHAYTSSGTLANDWFITPQFNLSSLSNPELAYFEYVDFSEDAVEHNVMYSTNYDGTGDPSLATWNDLNTAIGTEDTWIEKSGFQLPVSSTVYIAFEYFGEFASSWYIDDISIVDNIPDPEPSNHVSNFTAVTNGSYQINLTWSDNDGAQAAEGFLIVGKTGAGTFFVPVDGTEPSNDTDWGDNNFEVKVAHGVQAYSVTGLTPDTEYDFKIYPYTNSGSDIDFKTDGTVPPANATTDEGPCLIENFDVNALPSGWTQSDVTFISNYAEFAAYTGTMSLINLGNANHLNFTLARTTNTNAKTMYVEVSTTSQSSGFTTVKTYDHSNTTSGGTTTCSVDLSAYSSNVSVYIRFRKASSTTSPWRLDNIEVFCGQMSIWNGALDSDWNTAGNWTNGIPDASTDVTIPATKADVIIAADETADCNNLTVDGTLTIQSNATNTGSLIINGTVSGSGTMTMERYISAWTNNDPGQSDGWHLLGTPIATFTINDSDFDPGDNDDFFGWSETTWEWLNHKAGNPTQMVPGYGYLAAYGASATKDFSGTFNNANVTHTDLSVTPTKGNGWHLLGNPFQSALHWTNAAGTWAPTNIATGAKILEDRTYIDITADGANQYIPANQGFFVKATNADNSITIPAAERVHNSTAFYKSVPANVLELVASDGVNNTVKTWVQFMDDATAGFDEKYDMYFLGGMYQAPYLYSKISETERLSTNRIAPVQESASVQLAFKSFHNVEYTIAANYVTSFDSNIDLILEDTQEAIQINLRETSQYSFMASANELTERFRLHILKSTGIANAEPLSGLNIYSFGNSLYFNTTFSLDATISIFNITGQEVYSNRSRLDGMMQIGLNVPTGWYVVKVMCDEGIKSEKIFIR